MLKSTLVACLALLQDPSLEAAQTSDFVVDSNGFVGIGTDEPTEQLSVYVGSIDVVTGSGSSSKTLKSNIQDFEKGQKTVQKLRTVTFDWKDPEYGTKDVGFVAEEVAAIEPLLATYGKDGKVTGVQYSKVATVLVNAIKEQQAQIETQAEQIAELQLLIGQKLKAS